MRTISTFTPFVAESVSEMPGARVGYAVNILQRCHKINSYQVPDKEKCNEIRSE